LEKRFSFTGTGAEYALIWLKNLFYRIITLNFYYPWAKTARIQYQFSRIEFAGSPLEFHGTANQMLKGYLINFCIILAIFGSSIAFVWGLKPPGRYTTEIISFILNKGYFLCFIIIHLLLPTAIHYTFKYRMSQASWRGIRFGYDGEHEELFWEAIYGAALTLITLGIGYPWLTVRIQRYVINHMRIAQMACGFLGRGRQLFILQIRFYLSLVGAAVFCLIIFAIIGHSTAIRTNDIQYFIIIAILLGIFILFYAIIYPTYRRNYLGLLINNIYIEHEGIMYPLKFEMSLKDARKAYLYTVLWQAFSLGIATPWAWVAKQKLVYKAISIDIEFPVQSLLQVNESVENSSGDELATTFGLDFGF
jgi:uncharacterized membrane protein YjgN (DUF898 family)